ncbi:ABC transporter permease [Salinactinospora qingdaonensis]|uniref:Aliphatic sulfonate ABC transporter permease SsuC n=1 Tax=Salinactinospora qingdaonensis TaxID=702744 RepID=A0ABP7FZV5_9ACTN
MATNAVESPDASSSPQESDEKAQLNAQLRQQQRAERRSRWFWRISGYVFFFGLWQFASSFLVADFIVPPPLAILEKMRDIIVSGEVWVHFGATLSTIAIGFTVAYVLGAALGMLIGRSRWWESFFGDWVMATLTTPGLVFALLTAMVFGLGQLGPIVAVIITSISYVTVNVVEGVKAMPEDLVSMARAYRRSRWQIVRHVFIPFLAPFFFTAVRYGFSIAWKIATLTEVIVGTAGIGFMMRREFQSFSMTGFLAWVLLFFAFALFLERVVLQRQMKRVLKWRPEVAK